MAPVLPPTVWPGGSQPGSPSKVVTETLPAGDDWEPRDVALLKCGWLPPPPSHPLSRRPREAACVVVSLPPRPRSGPGAARLSLALKSLGHSPCSMARGCVPLLGSYEER